MKITKKILFVAVLAIICYAIGYFLNMFVTNGFVFELNFSFDLLLAKNTLIYAFEFFAIAMLMCLFSWYKGIGKNPNKIIEAKEKDKQVYTGLEQAHFQTDKEIAKNYITIDYNKLPNTQIEGIPVKAEETFAGYKVTFAKPAHTLIIGTTGSGKTTTFINPTIQILANTKGKPSMRITDPKGELYALHAKSLIKRGYQVKVLDLRNPYCSIRWNPLEKPYELYQQMLDIDNQVKKNDEEGYYIFEDKKYYDVNEKNAAVQVKKQELFDEVYEELNDICSVLCPVKSKNDPIWESGAKNFILAICLAMLEDSENPQLEMTKEKFNFYNIMKIATNTQRDCADLIDYFKKRSPISKCVSLSKQVLDAGEKTRGSYLSTVFDKLALFSDMSICSLTSANEIEFGEIATKPTALFLQIPDEKDTRHTLAAMIILQAYKALVAKANTYADLALPRSVYILADEFGNMPRIHKLEQMITVGRSRRIWLSLVVQSYAQLAKVYDEKTADIIKSNCNIQIFIGTTDLKTIEEFSKKCGNFSIIQRNASFSSGNDNVGSSVSIKERPLIYPTELQQLNSPDNMGNAIVNVFGFAPIKSKFTPSYKSKHFVLEKTNQLLSAGKYFNEKVVFYDMLKRNDLILTDKKKKTKTATADVFLETLRIQVEKLDFESLHCADLKPDLMYAMNEKDYQVIKDLFAKLEQIAKRNKSDNYPDIKSLCQKANELEKLAKL